MIGKGGVVAALAITLLVSTPLRAAAHAELLSSVPAASARLGLAPAAVVLDFSEPLSPALSEATVVDPSGRPYGAHPTSGFELRVALLTNLPGTYRVTWHAVSATDGHSTQGSFTFTVEANGGASADAVTPGPAPLDVVVAAARWIEDAALLLAFGMLLIGWLAHRITGLDWVRPRLLPAVLVALGAGAVVVIGETAMAGVSTGGALTYLTASPAGLARIARVSFEALACAAVATRSRLLLAIALTFGLAALSASGHAIGAKPAWFGVTLDAAHLIAAGIWIGGIVAIATLRPPGGWRTSGRELLHRFTPYALAGFAASVGLGALQAVGSVGDVGALVTTAYGRILIAKASAVVAIIPLSVVAWKYGRTHLRAEAVIGVMVIGAAALLASFPVPARTGPGAGLPSTTAASGLPSGDELTLGAEAGQTLVGLTVSPAVPGTNAVTIYVDDGDGVPSAPTVAVTAVINGRSVALRACGTTCRNASATLLGNDSFSVHVGGVQGGTAEFRTPALPVASGTALLSRALSHMARLHSVALHETLTGGAGTTIVTDYHEVAPDLLEWSQPGGGATIVTGSTRYTRTQADQPWSVETGNPTVAEPGFSWTLFSPDSGVHLVGAAQIDGVATTEVAFFAGGPVTPVWFRFYVDAEGLVRQANMTAPGHFMTQTFGNFNVPFGITRP